MFPLFAILALVIARSVLGEWVVVWLERHA